MTSVDEAPRSVRSRGDAAVARKPLAYLLRPVNEHAQAVLDYEGTLPCTQVDPDWFFSDSGRDPIRRDKLEAVRRVCSGCPVRTDCLAWAVEERETGFWAGTSDADRDRLRRRSA